MGKKNDLIADQQLEIQELQRKKLAAVNALDNIYLLIVCVGGPLNDNKLEYTEEQLVIFNTILEWCDVDCR